MLKASFKKYQLHFVHPVLTSRGQMKVKNGYYLLIDDGTNSGVGECSFIEGLSVDDLANYESTLHRLYEFIEQGIPESLPLNNYPSLQFGMETALLDLQGGGNKILFPGDFTKGKKQIPINGLVWMGSKEFMLQQIERKLKDGFKCIKIKVAAIDFDEEVMLLDFIRQKFPPEIIEIRLDANGGFTDNEVFKKLDILSKYHIHSVEQPVKQGQIELMANICRNSPVPIALDEELIKPENISKQELLSTIKPQYIILKPSLLGGFNACNEWIKAASQHNINWWATSALESNIGLNAIAQWVFTQNNGMVQGLGTGGLYTNNISSPLFVKNGHLGFNPGNEWGTI